MAFVGSYSTENGDDCYDIPTDYEEFERTVPHELDEAWGISENWIDEEQEDD